MLFGFGDVDACVGDGWCWFYRCCLCEELVRRGCEVSVSDNFSSGHRSNIQHLLVDRSHRVRLFVGDGTQAKCMLARWDLFLVGLVYSLCFLGACASFKPKCLNLSKCSSFVFNFMLWDIAVAAMSRSASGMSVPFSLSFWYRLQ